MIHLNQERGGRKYMVEEAPKKKTINSSLFLLKLYKIKEDIEKLIIELEKIENE